MIGLGGLLYMASVVMMCVSLCGQLLAVMPWHVYVLVKMP